MSKLTTAENKLLKRGFDWATDSNGYDPSWDEMDVLEFLKLKPGTEAKDININIPRHRIVAAFKRLETAGKLPTVDNVIDFRPEQSLGETVETVEPPKRNDYDSLVNFVIDYREWENNNPDQVDPDQLMPGTKIKLTDDSIAEIVEPINPPGCFINAVRSGETLQVADGDYVVLGESVQSDEPEIKPEAKVREFQNTHWSNGDYVQLISDPRRIGQLIGIKNGGLYKIKFADGFATELKADAFLDQPFCKENSEVVLGESFFKVGEFVVTSAPGFEDKIFKVEKIYHTGMIGVIDKSNQSFSFPANWLNHYVEKVGKSKGKILENSERKRPAKGCGSGSLVVRQANKKRNAAKGRDPDIYYVYCYSYTDNYGKEIKSSISIPREQIVQVKSMIERKEHYVKIAKFLGKSLPCYY